MFLFSSHNHGITQHHLAELPNGWETVFRIETILSYPPFEPMVTLNGFLTAALRWTACSISSRIRSRSRVRLPALHIAAKKNDVKAATLLLQNEHDVDGASKVWYYKL